MKSKIICQSNLISFGSYHIEPMIFFTGIIMYAAAYAHTQPTCTNEQADCANSATLLAILHCCRIILISGRIIQYKSVKCYNCPCCHNPGTHLMHQAFFIFVAIKILIIENCIGSKFSCYDWEIRYEWLTFNFCNV